MAVEIQCGKCSKRFRVADKFAGKRVKCPNCGGPITVPAAGEQPGAGSGEQLSGEGGSVEAASPSEAVSDSAPQIKVGPPDAATTEAPSQSGRIGPPPDAESEAADAGLGDQWYMQTEDGEQYGPVDRAELDEWFAEGRIDQACQILCEGWDQWQWAEEVYSELAEESSGSLPSLPVTDRGSASRAGSSSSGSGLGDTDAIHAELAKTRPWVLLMAIVAMALGGLTLLGGLGWMIVSAVTGAIPLIAFALMLLATGGIQAWLGYLLLNYAQRIAHYLRERQPITLTRALQAQRAFWRLTGILVLTAIGLWLLAVILTAVLTVLLSS